MNRYTIQCIIKELLLLYQENALSQEAFQEVIRKYSDPNIDKSFEENFISYKETELIYLIFKEVPYYKIYIFLKNFIDTLKELSQNNLKLSCIVVLIEGCLCESLNKIHRRISTEADTHIINLLQKFYQRERLEEDTTILNLKRNSCNPAFLTGMDLASNINIEQLTLDGFTLEKEELGEKISKNNFQKKSNSEIALKRTIENYYSDTLLDNFINELKAILEAYKEINPEDAGDLITIYNVKLESLRAIKKKKSQRKQQKDPNQLSLIFN